MSDHLDPQVQAAFVNGGFAFLGGGGVGLLNWLRARRRSSREMRCERTCWSMVNVTEKMLAVIEALGGHRAGLEPHISEARKEIAKARAYLEGDEA
jgi:hypothetical protein